MTQPPDSLLHDIACLLAQHQGVLVQDIFPGTRLREDLKIDGDDADEFIRAFATRFDVDLTQFHFHRYFREKPHRGNLLLWLWPWPLRGDRFVPITVDDLVRYARMRRWVDAPSSSPRNIAIKTAVWGKRVFMGVSLIVTVYAASPEGRSAYFFYQGISALDRYRYDAAIDYFSQAIAYNPKSYFVHNQLGVAYRWKARAASSTVQPLYEQAINHHRKAIELWPGAWLAHASLGYTYLCNHRTHLAAREFGEVFSIYPHSGRAHLGFGWLYTIHGFHALAIEEYYKALEQDPLSAHAYNNLGDVYLKERKFDLAAKMLRQAIMLDKDLAVAYRLLAEVDLLTGAYAQARDYFLKAIEIHETGQQQWAGLYVALQLLGEPARAEHIYNNAFRRFQDRAAFLRLVGFYFGNIQQYPQAINAYQKALALKPDQANWLQELGHIYREAGLSSEALRLYQEAITISEETAGGLVLYEMARIYAGQNQRDPALAYANKALKADSVTIGQKLLLMPQEEPLAAYLPDIKARNTKAFADYYGMLGWFYEHNRRPRAMEMYQKAFELNPDSQDSYVLEGIGRLYHRRGDYDAAIHYFQQASEVNPEETYGLYWIGYLHYIRGQNHQAWGAFKEMTRRKKTFNGYLGWGFSLEKDGRMDEARAVYQEGLNHLSGREARWLQRYDRWLSLLSRVHLIGLHAWARAVEARLQRTLVVWNMTHPAENLVISLSRGFFAKPLWVWCLLGLLFTGACVGIIWWFWKSRRHIKNLPPERTDGLNIA